MKYYLIGNPLAHSWSPQIHKKIADLDYELCPLKEDQVAPFLQEKAFAGLNVTIPYKQLVLKYVDILSSEVEQIGAANCIIPKDGKLYAYNTDYYGLCRSISDHNYDLSDKKVAVLGTGGAAKACIEVVRDLNGIPCLISRSHKGDLSYEELYAKEAEFSFIINATPVGMYPHTDETPLDLSRFSKLEGLIDIIANPLRTALQSDAKLFNIPYFGGLEMLVNQAYEADKLFLEKDIDQKKAQNCFHELLAERRNIALIGMPGAGKSTIAELLGKKLNKPVFHSDEMIIDRIKMPIADYFAAYGEESFRDQESETIMQLKDRNGIIISCGGGVIKRKINMRMLAENSLIIYLDRDLDKLLISTDRPLSANFTDLKKLYEERKELYDRYCDHKIKNNDTAEEAVEEICRFLEGNVR